MKFPSSVRQLTPALFTILVLTAVAPRAFGQAGVQAWVQRYSQPVDASETGNDTPNAIAVDSSGSVFVTGSSVGNDSSFDYATIKYSGAGMPLWTNRYSWTNHYLGNFSDYANAIALDASGNVFVTGISVGGDGSFDYATIKYSGAGLPLWTNRYNGPASPGNNRDYARAVATDGSGNVFVTGSSYGNGSSDDYVTIKYSDAGVPLWTNRYNGPGTGADFAFAITVDGSGNVIVTGYSYGVTSSYDYATIKYSAAGVPLWTNRYNGPGNFEDYANAVTVDGGGNVFVTGYSDGSTGYSDYATIKYSGAGVALWTNRYGSSVDDFANAIAVDSSGNVLVTGIAAAFQSFGDYATIKYSGAGVPLWTNRYNGPGNNSDSATAVAVDGSGNAFVTGRSTGSGSSYDYATIAYSGKGVPLWTNRFNGLANGDDQPQGKSCLAIGPDGAVHVTGASDGNDTSATIFDFATIKYISVPVLNIEPDGSSGFNIDIHGMPGATYHLQRAASVTGPWSNVATNTAPASGLIELHETSPPPGQSFYRTVQP